MEIMTFKQFKDGEGYYSNREFIIQDSLEALKDDDILINFAYTDYGGDFFDRVCIQYFIERKEECFISEPTSYFGRNGLLWGDTAKEFIEQNKTYPLGFDDLDDFHSQQQYEAERDSFEFFLKDLKGFKFDHDAVLSWLMENKRGYYAVLSSGNVDFNSSDLEEELIKEGLITATDEA